MALYEYAKGNRISFSWSTKKDGITWFVGIANNLLAKISKHRWWTAYFLRKNGDLSAVDESFRILCHDFT